MRSFAPIALFAAGSHAFWRMACPGRLTLQRIDPIITPGAISGHVHTVSGGSGFSFSSSYEQQRASVCSSCPIKADLSAYWTPKLYYMRQDGQFEDVPQSGEGSVNTGGLTVYYLQRSGKKPGSLQTETINAFPPGLRMVAGDPRQRNGSDAQAAPGKAISFVCLDYNNGSSTTYSLPNKNCPQGLRAQVFFPSCWNGQSNDTADHKSHMAYPIGHYDSGYCPDTHPIRLVSIFYEVTYNVGNFANRWYNSDGSHPFVFAQGDRTGYGFHGDFLNGWDTPTLQAAINQCNSNSGLLQYCPVFNNGLYSGDESESCEIPASVDEQTQGVLPALPGCNTPTVGPDYAPKSPANCAANLVSMNTIKPFYTDVTSTLGWSYVGCGNDSVSSRTFTGAYSSSSQMTIERCITTCAGKNFTLAGLQYGSQCFCDNQYNNQPNDYRAPIPGIWGQCGQPCAGNNQQICGGPSALSVYQVCTGISCANQPFQQFPGLVNQIVGGVNGVINSTIPAVGSVVNSTVGDVTGVVNSTVGAVNGVVNSTVGGVNNVLNNTLGAIGL